MAGKPMQFVTAFSGVLCLALAIPQAAHARSQPVGSSAQRARQAWTDGRALYQGADYAAALERFRVGCDLSGKGGFLFNMAECKRLLGSRADARALYLRYLEENPTGKHRQLAARRNAVHLGASLLGSLRFLG